MPRITKREWQARVDSVYLHMRNGDDIREVAFFIRHAYGVSDRQARDYIAAARKRFAEEAAIGRAAHIGKVMSRIDELYQSARQRGDKSMMLAILKEQIKIVGLTESAPDPALDQAAKQFSAVPPQSYEVERVNANDAEMDEIVERLAGPRPESSYATSAAATPNDELDRYGVPRHLLSSPEE